MPLRLLFTPCPDRTDALGAGHGGLAMSLSQAPPSETIVDVQAAPLMCPIAECVSPVRVLFQPAQPPHLEITAAPRLPREEYPAEWFANMAPFVVLIFANYQFIGIGDSVKKPVANHVPAPERQAVVACLALTFHADLAHAKARRRLPSAVVLAGHVNSFTAR